MEYQHAVVPSCRVKEKLEVSLHTTGCTKKLLLGACLASPKQAFFGATGSIAIGISIFIVEVVFQENASNVFVVCFTYLEIEFRLFDKSTGTKFSYNLSPLFCISFINSSPESSFLVKAVRINWGQVVVGAEHPHGCNFSNFGNGILTP